MVDLEAIKEACCTTECTAFSLGNCPFWGNSLPPSKPNLHFIASEL